MRRRELTAPALRRSRGDEQQSGLDYHQNTDPTVDAIDQCLVSTAHLSECNLLAIRACTSEPTVSRDHTHSEGGMTNAQQMKLQFCPRYASRALPSCRLIPLHFAMICIRTLRTCRLIPLQKRDRAAADSAGWCLSCNFFVRVMLQGLYFRVD